MHTQKTYSTSFKSSRRDLEDKVQALLQARKSEREEAEAKEQRLRADFQAAA